MVHLGTGPYVAYRNNTIDDSPPGGNGNGWLGPGESADLIVTLGNAGAVGVNGLTGRLRPQDQYITVLDSLGVFGNVEPDSVRSNDADRFRVQASPATPRGHPAEFALHLFGTDYADSVKFTIRVSESRATDPIPDGPRQPALYWAYDDVDWGYSQRPTYDWLEIKSQGTRLSFPNDDAVIVVNLPLAFGPFKYYGQRFTQISVSADGWISPGSFTTPKFLNTGLPSSLAPPGAICANWDDLYPGYDSSGSAYYYHDAANHRFVVEFDSVAYYRQTSVRDKFEVIFYDTTLAAPDGNTVFEFQYMTANHDTSSTVGIQSAGKTIGIQGLFNGSYHAGCYPLGPRRAIKFTTDEPQTSIAEPPSTLRLDSPRLLVAPNPLASGFAVLRVQGVQGSRGQVAEVRVFDASGRCVLARRFDVRTSTYAVPLDIRSLSSGVYLVRLDADGCTATQKIVVQRNNRSN